MPYERKSLTDLRAEVAQDIATALPGSDPLLPFSNLAVVGNVQAGLSHLQYGYLDWIAQQSQPWSATGEYMEAWGALKGVVRKPAATASGVARFTGADGAVIPAGAAIVRGDGATYTATAAATVTGGAALVPITADADVYGLSGAAGNCQVGTVVALSQAVAGISTSGTIATACTGGADLEADATLRTRMMLAYRETAHGGAEADYVAWALAVPGVTRAWCVPHGYGAGTVLVYVMLDNAQAAHDGFPQGTNGVAAAEPRAAAATGDQLTVADALFTLRPVTALVYVVAPTANVVPFTITGLSGADAATKAAVADAIALTLDTHGKIERSGPGTVALSLIESAITAVPSTTGFVITEPPGNISSPMGSLPKLGTITWA